VLSLDGGRQLRPASLDPEGKSLEARGVLAFAAALVRPHIRTYAYALRCLLALQSRQVVRSGARRSVSSIFRHVFLVARFVAALVSQESRSGGS
jgi:hypothetical protein